MMLQQVLAPAPMQHRLTAVPSLNFEKTINNTVRSSLLKFLDHFTFQEIIWKITLANFCWKTSWFIHIWITWRTPSLISWEVTIKSPFRMLKTPHTTTLLHGMALKAPKLYSNCSSCKEFKQSGLQVCFSPFSRGVTMICPWTVCFWICHRNADWF